ncbi:MAG: efflux RND transporter periplasmic adaptor subunit [Brotaphodocola sp.]
MWKERFRSWKEKIKNRCKSRKKANKNKKKIAVMFAGALILIGGGSAWLIHARAQKTSAKASEVRTATVTRGNLSSELTSAGTIEPKDTYSITSLVEGEVISADFEEGDQVTKDQVLYQIDVSSMESEVRSAANSLERAINNYNRAMEDYEEAISDYSGNTYKSTRTGFVKTLQVEVGDKVGSNTEIASIYNDQTMKMKVPFLSVQAAGIGVGEQAVITLSDTEEQLAGVVTSVGNMDEVLSGGRMVRYVTLEVANPGGLTINHTASVTIRDMVCCEESSFEPITDTKMKAEITGNSTLEIETLLVHEGDFVTVGTPIFRIKSKDVEDILQDFKDSVDSAEEKVESAQTKMDSTQENYENYTITAPISGQVITKSIKTGDKISKSSSGGSTTMAVIYDLSEMTFEMSVDELDVRKVQVGQTVQVTADALEGVKMTGKVTNISLESSQSNGVTNYPVTVTMDEIGDLLPGMNVDGTIILDAAENVLMIPVDALMRGNRVYVRDDSVKEAQGSVPVGFRAVEVETGMTSDDYVEIVSGLEEGTEVYVSASSKDVTSMFPMGGMGGMPGAAPGGNMGGGNRQNGGSNRQGGGSMGGPRQ